MALTTTVTMMRLMTMSQKTLSILAGNVVPHCGHESGTCSTPTVGRTHGDDWLRHRNYGSTRGLAQAREAWARP
jgi:hypothetical protein